MIEETNCLVMLIKLKINLTNSNENMMTRKNELPVRRPKLKLKTNLLMISPRIRFLTSPNNSRS